MPEFSTLAEPRITSVPLTVPIDCLSIDDLPRNSLDDTQFERGCALRLAVLANSVRQAARRCDATASTSIPF
jgi:hypothetical protein